MDERWREIERIYHAARELDRSERAAFLAQACAGDDGLRREVESLLVQADQSASFLQSPAIEVAAGDLVKGGGMSDSSRPAVEVGAMIAHYRLTSKLGEGGMGEVYRARDTKLRRDVAIKILPQSMARDAERMARFEREARTLASLNHPNIAAIHGIEESNGIRALVMELVEGKTLAERLRRTQPSAHQPSPQGRGWSGGAGPGEGSRGSALAVEDALPLAKQIAEALEYAHERGVIHRDLKPANVKITPEGTVKVLDFGLAKVLNPQDSSNALDPANSPTLSTMATKAGVILGTASYMSPEQAKGQRVDRRCDIWAFGCVLYEMLSGKKPFEGETISDVLVAVITKDPDWAAIPETTHPSIQKLIHRCLVKDARQRLRDIGDARIAIEETLSGSLLLPSPLPPGEGGPRERDRVRVSPLRHFLPLFAGIMIGAIASGLIVWRILSPRAPATRPAQGLSERRLTANPSGDPVQAAAISPDGKFLAYSDQNGTHLRLIKTGDTRDLLSHRQLIVSSIGWLPDGSGIMVTGSQHGQPAGIWTISVLGGTPRKLRDNAVQPAVSPDGSRVAFLAGSDTGAPSEIWVMNASGEGARRILTAQSGQAFRRLRWSPGGHRFMYLKSYFAAGGPEAAIESVDLKGGSGAPVVSSPTLGDFCWLPDGRVLYSRQSGFTGVTFTTGSSLWQISVDARTGKTRGAPAKVATGAGFYFSGLSRSADGNQLVFLKLTSQSDVSVGDLDSQGTALTKLRQLTFNQNDDWLEGWTPDGKAVVFWSDRNGKGGGFYKKNLIGGEALPLFPAPEPVWYVRYSPDDSWFLYMALPKSEYPGPTVPENIMRVAVSGGTPQLVLRARGMSDLRCARSPANVCIYDERDQQGQAFFEFDPLRGKGREVARIPNFHRARSSSWDLSPDGSRLAVIDPAGGQEGRIKLIPVKGGQSSELAVKGSNGLTEMDWSPDGKALYVSSVTAQHAAVLHVDLKGRARLLWEGNPTRDTCGKPSPDGRHLAIAVWTTHSNAWIMKNFQPAFRRVP